MKDSQIRVCGRAAQTDSGADGAVMFGCLAAAAAFAGAVPVEGKRVGVILSGGNVDLASFARFIAPSA